MRDKATELEQLARACHETHGAMLCLDVVAGARGPDEDGIKVQPGDCAALADTLAAGRVFMKLREAAEKAGVVELIDQFPGVDASEDLPMAVGAAMRILLAPNDHNLPTLEAAADRVLGGGV